MSEATTDAVFFIPLNYASKILMLSYLCRFNSHCRKHELVISTWNLRWFFFFIANFSFPVGSLIKKEVAWIETRNIKRNFVDWEEFQKVEWKIAYFNDLNIKRYCEHLSFHFDEHSLFIQFDTHSFWRNINKRDFT